MKINEVGLIVNPYAGLGKDVNLNLARSVLELLGVSKVWTAEGLLGGDAISGSEVESTVFPVIDDATRMQTHAIASELIKHDLDAVIVVGGDGTLSDVAYVFSQRKVSVPILGIGAGSTNAGALITCKAEDVRSLKPEFLEVRSICGLLAMVNGEFVGVGFNDCVLGFTVVATINNELRDISVREKISGKNIPGEPAKIGLPETKVTRLNSKGIGELASGELASGEWIGTVVVGMAEPTFVAKAITGGVCLTSLTGIPAGCLISNLPLVTIEIKADHLKHYPPINSTYVSLDEGDSININGVRNGTGLNIDGNPIFLLVPESDILFSVQRDILKTIKIK